ncbi:MAG: hypothetical protein ABMB14_36170, partial [Myxococcota bacterium]
MDIPPTITALTAARALATLRDAGCDWEVEARRAGVPVELAPEFAWRAPIAAVDRLFARGAAVCGPDFPLIARPPRAEDNRSPVNLYCRTRDTVREALDALEALTPHVTDAYAIRVVGPGVVRWCGAPYPALWWFDLADLVASVRSVFPRGPHLVRVTTPFPAPPGAAADLGCRIEPGPQFEATLAPELVARRIPPTDAAVRAHV